MVSIYLDDERPTPTGWIRTYSVQETIDLIRQHEGNIYQISLDNDLGVGLDEGYHVMNWIEKEAFNNTLKPIPHLMIHTGNSSARDRMMKARHNAWKYWTEHGYKRGEMI